jgi:hypothetical protein
MARSVNRPPPPPRFRILTYTCPEVKTITAVYKATRQQMIADVDGVAHLFEDRIWGMIQDLGEEGVTSPQQFVGLRLVPKQDQLRQWRYVPVRASPAPS